MEDLLPGHRDLDGLVQLARSEGREDRFRMNAQLGAESPAYEWCDNMDALRIHSQGIRDGAFGRIDDLCADIYRKVLAARDHHAVVRLHRLRELIGRGVGLIDFDGRAVEGGLKI